MELLRWLIGFYKHAPPNGAADGGRSRRRSSLQTRQTELRASGHAVIPPKIELSLEAWRGYRNRHDEKSNLHDWNVGAGRGGVCRGPEIGRRALRRNGDVEGDDSVEAGV